MFGCSREADGAPLRWEHCQGSMRNPSFITLLSALSLAGGSFGNGPENDGSGDGPSTLPTVTVTSHPATGSSTVNDHETVLVAASATESSFETESTSSSEPNAVNDEDTLEAAEQSILLYVVPVVLLVLLILLITFFVIHHRRKKSKQGFSHFHHCARGFTQDELGSENVKSPIFEEDTPSVMEIEMEELDKWMNSMNKNADCECLPTVREEEKESIANPSDGES
ncbi:transmembrane protein 154 isoform X1 [Pipra filicauda]|uniref:Transmembrane protein 154 isoform X1 n=1 Tax=Pipra filicauda TaxID=649802 RepID=A0A7R5KHB1_9PASS|nr:transmembrane protein 154 isoform X1 [Pipra filicauda]